MRKAVASLLAGLLTLSAAPSAQTGLDDVMKAAAAYVSAYQKNLQGLVAEEYYIQGLSQTLASRATGRGRIERQGRQLRSDLLLVKLVDDDWWLQFRDVFEVDRRPVRDRDQRLVKLFIESKADARAQAESIQRESARYNLGPIMRTINIPIMALLFFETANQPRLDFKLANAGNVNRFRELARPESIRLVEFKETQKGTMVKGANDRDIPSHGRVWIDVDSGRILRTELISEDTELRAMIDVSYAAEPGLDILVPREMREIYHVRRNDVRIDGRATYSKFRRFTVTTAEKPKGR